MTGCCAERSSTAFSTQDDLDGVVDLARHRDGDDRRSSAIAAVGGLTGDRRCADDADQADCHRGLDRLNRLRRVADRPLASETYRALDGARGSGKAERAAGLKIEER
jgi:hypothetical protein